MAGKRADKFPLYLHPSGQWCKKRQGRAFYFGTDRDAALRRYVREWPLILAGRTTRIEAGSIVLADLANAFLTAKRAEVTAGAVSLATWHQYHAVAERMLAVLGPSTETSELKPDDFAALKANYAASMGALALRRYITLTKAIFRWAYESERLEKPLRYGPGFEPPAKRLIRLARAARGKRLVEPADLRKLIAAATPQLRAMIYLGINCGFGGKDCSDLTDAALKRPGWVELHRQKTGTARRCPLWPETAKALKAARKVRPEPASSKENECVFLTRGGHRWDRYTERPDGTLNHLSSVSEEYRKLRLACGVEHPGGFYTLRHTFRTVADASKDQPACMLIMGHVDQSISETYRETIADERLVAVVELVRRWLDT